MVLSQICKFSYIHRDCQFENTFVWIAADCIRIVCQSSNVVVNDDSCLLT